MKHVFFSGLKFKITLNLIFILMAGMVLIDFVVTITVQELLVRSETSQGYFFIHALERQNLIGLPPDPKAMAALDRAVRELLNESNFSGAVLVVGQASPRSYGALPPVLQNELRQLAAAAIRTGGRESRFSQRTWGVFWQQPRYLLISAPLTAGPRGATGIGLLYDLNRIYQPLRQSQKILLWYLLVNTIILTLIGLYRIGQITLKPLFRIVQRAESYSETEDTLFAPERTENEFALLSRALNQMLLRVTQDKNRLRTTVDALTEANRDLEKAQREVIRAEKLASIGRLSAGIAHEIGNPLGIILGYLDLLKQADLSRDERFDFIDRSEKEINRIHAIIRQLLDISRTSPVEAMPLDVHAILRDMVRGFQLQPIMRNIQFTLELSALRDRILADPQQLRQVFINLLINARDAIFSKGEDTPGLISIASTISSANVPGESTGEPWLEISFRDNGCGIPQEHAGNIFDPFFTTKEPGKGTGLGLAVCYMLVRGMGGHIAVRSQTGEETAFYLVFPLAPSD